MTVDEPTIAEDGQDAILIGDGYIDDAVEESSEDINDRRYQPLTKAELKQLQDNIANTTRPPWHRGPPVNLGEPGHGKLKADQWRSCIEFDLPVFVAQLWSGTDSITDDQRALDRQKLAHSTMLLAMAIRWGTSHKTSQHHVDQYMKYLHAYLESLIDIFPHIKLRPNHHVALHIGEYLLRFGPSHGWWMFPFERLIGILQQVNTSNRFGKIYIQRRG
jgi:hypothetical protein